MMYFVKNIFTYSATNNARRELREFIDQFEYLLIQDECSLDALCAMVEVKIAEINDAHPKMRPVKYERDSSTGRVSAFIKTLAGSPDYVFFMDICQVRSTFCFSEKAQDTLLQKLPDPGTCRECGCTENDPCFNPGVGCCWWADDEHTICSHCADPKINDDPHTEHCINTKHS